MLTRGKEVIPCKYKDAWRFSEGLVRVTDDKGKCGLYDKAGKEVVVFDDPECYYYF